MKMFKIFKGIKEVKIENIAGDLLKGKQPTVTIVRYYKNQKQPYKVTLAYNKCTKKIYVVGKNEKYSVKLSTFLEGNLNKLCEGKKFNAKTIEILLLADCGVKRCTKCDKPKDFNEFYVDRSRPDKHMSWCKECFNKRNKGGK